MSLGQRIKAVQRSPLSSLQKQVLREDRIASSVSAFQSPESNEPEEHSDKYELVLVVASKDEVLLVSIVKE